MVTDEIFLNECDIFYINMSEEYAEKQQSLAGVYAEVVMEQTKGSFKDKFVAAMAALMSSSAPYNRKKVATKVYEIIEDSLGVVPEKLNPGEGLYQLCKFYEWDDLDLVELIMEFEAEFDINLHAEDESFLRECSIAGLIDYLFKIGDMETKKKSDETRSGGHTIDDYQ